MVFIVNLSTIHKLRSIPQVIATFGELRAKSNANVLFDCCPNIFHKLTNAALVAAHYLSFSKTIHKYKLGTYSTEIFLEKLLEIFPFLNKEGLQYEDELIDHLFENKAQYFTLHAITDKTALTNRVIATALLEQCWNSLVQFDEDCTPRLQHLIDAAGEQPIYFVSNTNTLHVNYILFHLRSAYPDIQWTQPVNVAPGQTGEPILIAPNIHLCLSYVYGTYKTAEDNQLVTEETPLSPTGASASEAPEARSLLTSDLIPLCIGQLRKKDPSAAFTVVSQWPKDLEAATRFDHAITVMNETFYSSLQGASAHQKKSC